MQAWAWFSALKHYFIVVGITYVATEAADTEAAYQYTVRLMGSNAARWIVMLEIQCNAPNSFPEFEKLFINQYTLLDHNKIAQDKLCELWQYRSI